MLKKIIDLYKKSIKAEEYKSQLEKIYETCRIKRGDRACFLIGRSTDEVLIEERLKNDGIIMAYDEILGIINI